MKSSTIEKNTNGTITINITIPQDELKKARVQIIEEMVKEANLPGFRKGKAPQKLVEENINKDQLRERILKKLLPQAYMDAITQHGIKPIMNPQLNVEKIDEQEDWVVQAMTCEMPEVDLAAYKKEVQKITAKSKIIIPGKESKKPTTDEVLKVVLDQVKVQVPQILIDQETDKLLAQLLDDIKKLGLSLEQYLATTRRSPDDLRTEYAQRAQNDIKIEFVLQKIAETEKITVEPKEIDEAIQKAKDPAEKQNLEDNRYLLAGILRQQKTLDFLMNL